MSKESLENGDKRKNVSAVNNCMIFGMLAGAILGVLFFDGNVSGGAVVGLCLGIVVGAIIDSSKAKEQKK